MPTFTLKLSVLDESLSKVLTLLTQTLYSPPGLLVSLKPAAVKPDAALKTMAETW